MFIGNVFNKFIPETFKEGISYSAKKLLRLAIILYGFRITFQQIFAVGIQGFWADVIILSTTNLLGLYLAKKSKTKRTKVPMPWFAILFVVMCGFNSLNILPVTIKSGIIEFDVLLLTIAMFGLGVETNFEKIKGLGLKPILLAGIMFVWLVCIGALTAKFI